MGVKNTLLSLLAAAAFSVTANAAEGDLVKIGYNTYNEGKTLEESLKNEWRSSGKRVYAVWARGKFGQDPILSFGYWTQEGDLIKGKNGNIQSSHKGFNKVNPAKNPDGGFYPTLITRRFIYTADDGSEWEINPSGKITKVKTTKRLAIGKNIVARQIEDSESKPSRYQTKTQPRKPKQPVRKSQSNSLEQRLPANIVYGFYDPDSTTQKGEAFILDAKWAAQENAKNYTLKILGHFHGSNIKTSHTTTDNNLKILCRWPSNYNYHWWVETNYDDGTKAVSRKRDFRIIPYDNKTNPNYQKLRYQKSRSSNRKQVERVLPLGTSIPKVKKELMPERLPPKFTEMNGIIYHQHQDFITYLQLKNNIKNFKTEIQSKKLDEDYEDVRQTKIETFERKNPHWKNANIELHLIQPPTTPTREGEYLTATLKLKDNLFTLYGNRWLESEVFLDNKWIKVKDKPLDSWLNVLPGFDTRLKF